jgi:hypothetical protein
MQYAVALALTISIEAPLVALGLGRWYRLSIVRGVVVGAGASLLSHPVVWFPLYGVLAPSVGYLGYLILAEAFAWLLEAAIFWLVIRRDVPGLLLLSLVANLASFALGATLQALGLL